MNQTDWLDNIIGWLTNERKTTRAVQAKSQILAKLEQVELETINKTILIVESRPIDTPSIIAILKNERAKLQIQLNKLKEAE